MTSRGRRRSLFRAAFTLFRILLVIFGFFIKLWKVVIDLAKKKAMPAKGKKPGKPGC